MKLIPRDEFPVDDIIPLDALEDFRKSLIDLKQHKDATEGSQASRVQFDRFVKDCFPSGNALITILI